MFLITRYLVLIVFSHSSVFAVSPSISKKGILLNWASRMWQDVDVSLYTCPEIRATAVLRSRSSEKNFESDTGLSLLLPDCCPEAMCDKSTCSGVAEADQKHKFVLSKTESDAWVVSCKLFNNIELPTSQGGTPEQRIGVGDDSTRGLAATRPQASTTIAKPIIQGFGSDPPQQGQNGSGLLVIEGGNLGAVSTTTQAPTLSRVVCDSLFTTDAETFFAECCMKNGVAESDARCVLRTLLQKMEAQKKHATATTTLKSTTTAKATTIKKTSLGFGITAADVVEEDDASTTAKSPPAEASPDEFPTAKSPPAEEFFSPSESEKVVWSLTGQISSWRSKYFTVLGFFLVFLVFFLFIIAALIYKLRAAKASSPPTSPGADAGCGSGRYDVSGAQGERAPLTPSTQQEQTFKY
eukprot:GFUD01025872.1.p1 GENE.GFUD01025872.1~~GFUD01025872.1.p1  ORF type:complete len:433 (+),score=86.99 GFUD01025872.1:71-1300(+)